MRIENCKLEEYNALLKSEQTNLNNIKTGIQQEIDLLNKTINDKTNSLTAIDNTIKSM